MINPGFFNWRNSVVQGEQNYWASPNSLSSYLLWYLWFEGFDRSTSGRNVKLTAACMSTVSDNPCAGRRSKHCVSVELTSDTRFNHGMLDKQFIYEALA